jgi:hypothetical protein
VAAHRVYDSTTRLYSTFQAPESPGGVTYLTLTNIGPPALASGSYRMEIQTTCDDASTDVLDTGPASDLGPTSSAYGSFLRVDGEDVKSATLIAGKNYFLVLSELDPGLQPTFTFGEPF